jgi:mannose-1-phosphate guanylyltransferase/mannose-6-phosphate isomerase
LDYEIFERPWGFYKTTILNDFYQSKVLEIHPKCSISLQEHRQREEHWIVVNGEGNVQIGESILPVHGGSSLFIPKGCRHRMTNTSATENLIIIEVQRGQYFGEDDIIRFDDEYGRV